MPRRQVGYQIFLRCAQNLSESTKPEIGGRGRPTGAHRRPRRRIGWLEGPRGHPVAIWALVATAAVVRESGSVLGVRMVSRLRCVSVSDESGTSSVSCSCSVSYERARRWVEAAPKLADVHS